MMQQMQAAMQQQAMQQKISSQLLAKVRNENLQRLFKYGK